MYVAKAAEYGLAPEVAKMKTANNGDFTADIAKATEQSYFTTKEKVLGFLADPKPVAITHDPLYIISNDLLTKYRSKTDDQAKADDGFATAFRKLVEGLRESKLNAIKYPDANSTLRLTYGKVRALPADPRNDAKINNYTTMESMVKKYKAGDQEFDLPARLLELNKKKISGSMLIKQDICQ